MSDNKKVDNRPEKDQTDTSDTNIAVTLGEGTNVSSVKNIKHTTSSDRQIKFERAQKCLENAALVSKRIKEHRKATAELLGKPFDDDVTDTASEMASTMSERTGYSVATDTSTTLSVQDALNIPGISESLANTLRQKELIMERIKQYKEISKRPMKKSSSTKKESYDINVQDAKKGNDSSDAIRLINTIKEKENVLSVMQVKMKALETTILDLQEKINEKDQIIEAKNKATTLISDSLSKKEKDTFDLLEDTRQQMTKMQSNFIKMEAEWKDEKQRLIQQIEEQEEKIKSLEEANSILENSRFEISLAHSKLAEELESKNKEILHLQEKIEALSQITVEKKQSDVEVKDVGEEKGSLEIANMVEITKKIELLEQINCEIRRTNKDLENQIASINVEQKPTSSSPIKKVSSSPHPTRKGGRSNSSKSKSPWSNLSIDSTQHETEKSKSDISKHEMLVQSLNKDILEKEYLISQKDELISRLQSENNEKENAVRKMQLEIETCKSNIDNVDVGVSTEALNSQPFDTNISEIKTTEPISITLCESISDDVNTLQEKLRSAENQIALLNDEIEIANKNMIKVKSNYKIKLKQMQKTIDNFSKVSDANSEIVKLNEEIHQLSQKVAELEEEKGNLQLHLVDYDSGRLTETEVYKKLVEMENLADSRLNSITLLETQKFDLVQELHVLQQKSDEMEDKLADMAQLQNDHVCSEIKSVQLEEQIDELIASKKEMELVIDNLKLDKEQSMKALKTLQEEKEDIIRKLENYIQENMELTDKLEKLSAEKVSSTESIEMVESLTTQEKLELEEYNKTMETKHDHSQLQTKIIEPECIESMTNLVEQSAELNKKVELFTQERQEVMANMNKVCTENKELHDKITELKMQCSSLNNKIDILSEEKNTLQSLTEELNSQIEVLKRERLDIMKETIEIPKPLVMEESVEGGNVETSHDEKVISDKGNRSKSVKQLTKDILKLKTTIKEREAEIADCQMKILSLEEQQQKHQELAQNTIKLDNQLKHLTEENSQLKRELVAAQKDSESDNNYKHANDLLQQEVQKIHQEYSMAINARDSRIHELENLLMEYEKQMFSYGNSLQQKDKEIAEYINQITKLNDISQKLKSTIELLEEEKAKDQNAELVKSLNKEIMIYQKKFAECEEKLRILEEEKVELLSVKTALEVKSNDLEIELKQIQESLMEKQTAIKELQIQKQKQDTELSTILHEAKERDEEIHEIKLQLRKESIENEKLRNEVSEKVNAVEEFKKQCNELSLRLNSVVHDKDNANEQYVVLENKNKELLEKLKKLAVNIKKKSSLYSELEGQYNDAQKQLEHNNLKIEQLLSENEVIPKLQNRIKDLEKELAHQQNDNLIKEQRLQDISHLETEYQTLDKKRISALEEISKLNMSIDATHRELMCAREDNENLTKQIETLNKKLVEYEIDQKNSTNLLTKITCLENDLSQKEHHIIELSCQIDAYNQQFNQLQFAHDAKVQECNMYIESLQAEIDKYKNRICRLEESISVMENRRHSLERKADQLDTQLQEKQKAYSEYTNQEDELVNRLAMLIDHDRVVEKQVHEVEIENQELQFKIQHANEEIQHLRNSCSELQMQCNSLQNKASKVDEAESELGIYQSKLHELEVNLKRVTSDHQMLLTQRKIEIEELESEFNTQIENAIKEKKSLSEKYEKVSEHLTQMEHRLQEYKDTNENLCINLEELSVENKKLIEKNKINVVAEKDYTDQYITEINKLNALVNNQKECIFELENKITTLQRTDKELLTGLENKVAELLSKLSDSSIQIEHMTKEFESIKQNNDQLQTLLLQKDEQIKNLTEKNKVVFEMNIPKTEGMTISSMIEQVNDQSNFDLEALQSQIVSESSVVHEEPSFKKVPESTFVQSYPTGGNQSHTIVQEPIIVPKKQYDCYKKDDNLSEEDPFSSQEGWGFGGEETVEVSPLYSNLNEQNLKLKNENEKLKLDLDASSVKLLKVVRKLKELKSTNDMLSKELKLSKQLSEQSILDAAIENELSSNLNILEKKLEELNSELEKEKREKETLKKQNEIFKNANDRLTEMKEKMDNELELWKYNFKQANDKISSLQWSTESKDSIEHKIPCSIQDKPVNEEINKLEKENDELQSVIDELNILNKKLTEQSDELTNRVNELEKDLLKKSVRCENCESFLKQLSETEYCNTSLKEEVVALNDKLKEFENRCKDLIIKNEDMSKVNEENTRQHESKITEFVNKISLLQQELNSLNTLRDDANNTINLLTSELEGLKGNAISREKETIDASEFLLVSEKLNFIEEQSSQLRSSLEDSNNKITLLENENKELKQSLDDYKKQVEELKSKIKNLNVENDQLLSTVAELRSSVSSAVDQRGYEIAELWKQHLAQREHEFQAIENELRSQLSAAESKYELLLENVHSATQDETNKLIATEQINSLQCKLQEKEEHLTSLRSKYAEVIHQLDMLRSETEDEKLINENKMLVQHEEFEKIIEELTKQRQIQSTDFENTIKNLQTELIATKSVNDNLNQQIDELRMNYEEKIQDLSKQLQIKESEIFQKTNDYSAVITQRNEEFENVRKQLLEYEKKVEDLTYEKEAELAVLRLKIHDNKEQRESIEEQLKSEINNITDALNAKIIECTGLNKQITDLNIVLQEYATKSAEMQTALENQELEIVSLKDEISNMQALIRSSSSRIEKHVTFAKDTKPADSDKTDFNKDLLDAVPRAELDIALYMLHQRDVRCEELTVELTQLLEERDTLQLRLSDSLRAYEELKSNCKLINVSMDSSQDSVSELPTFSIEKEQADTHRGQTSRSSSISDFDGEKPKLQAKLSELRSVKHSRDVTLRHESEQRQLGMRLLQRDVANLPPEALEQLTQAHHTLSRDTQSTSTVLLNWLRGKSTPKVVHM
ncbi:protein lava lamp-like [Battus philenor]|uniref:protein lava lamp-like n=1 Tax=Battus philenor TaxID=42288 RepID=UPI0035CF3D7D